MAPSVIISTHDRPRFLESVLTGFACQRHRDFEVIVADDGSGPETGAVIERGREELGLGIVHVWHEDRGQRLHLEGGAPAGERLRHGHGILGRGPGPGERLENLGIRGKRIRFRAPCLHLHHDRPYRASELTMKNRAIRDRIRRGRETRARVGIEGMLSADRNRPGKDMSE